MSLKISHIYPPSASSVAEYLIWLANETGSYISNLKLQKLLYYAQGWHLALFGGKRLFNAKFKAWVHGPVLPTVWHRYKDFGYKPIIEKVPKPELNPETEKFLKDIARVFFPLDAYELELATHRESPWINARKGLPPDAKSDSVISEEDMLKHFSALHRANAKNKAAK